jgi:hypothetical protein
MNMSIFFIVISIVILLVIALLAIFVAKRQDGKKLSPLAGLAFGFAIAGIVFGDDRFLSYSLFGAGIILSVIDIVRLARSR